MVCLKTDVKTNGADARDWKLESAMRRLDAYRVERTLAEKPGFLTELAIEERVDGSQTPVVLKHIARKFSNPLLWRRYLSAPVGRIPELLEILELPDEYVLVLQYVPGESLSDYVGRKGALDPGRARSIMDDLCDATSTLASVGIVHRDIKPSNVILSYEGAYLIDPGIARVSDNLDGEVHHDHDTLVLGTYGYAPPEQLGYAQTDARSDVFSLARVLGFMLTGIAPTEPDYLDALRNDRHIPDGLRIVISRACSLEPSLRPANAQALKRQIDANASSSTVVFPRGDDALASVRATGSPTPPSVRAEAIDSNRRIMTERREPSGAPQDPIANLGGEGSAPPANSSMPIDSDGWSMDVRPGTNVVQNTTLHSDGMKPVAPMGSPVTTGSDDRSLDVRTAPDVVLQSPIPIREGAIAESHPQKTSGARRVAIRLIMGFLGFFGTAFIIFGFTDGSPSLPRWANIVFGLTMGIFWNYLPAYELVQFLRGAGRYRRTGLPIPNVFKRTLKWFGIGFGILFMASIIGRALGSPVTQ